MADVLTSPPADTRADRLRAARARFQGPLTAVAVGSLPFLALEIEREQLARQDQVLIDGVNVIVLLVFAADYFTGLYLSDARGRYVRREWMELLMVVSQALVLVPTFAAFGVLRAARLTRVIRVVAAVGRVLAIAGIASRQGRDLMRRRATSFALSLALMTWVTSAVAFTLVEDVGEGGRLGSFFDALWWSLATITTVGYGDVFPITAAGRVIGGITMIVGISVFAIVTAKLAEFFTRDPGAN